MLHAEGEKIHPPPSEMLKATDSILLELYCNPKNLKPHKPGGHQVDKGCINDKFATVQLVTAHT